MTATRWRTAGFMLLMGMAILWFATLAHLVEASDDPDKTTFIIEPYVWLPTLKGDLKYVTLPSGSGGSPEIEIDGDDLLDDLDMAALLLLEVRKEKWSFFADFTYLDLSTSESKVKSVDFGGSVVSTDLDVGTDIEMKGFCTTFAGGYNIVSNNWLKTDLIAGARYLWLEAETDWDLSAAVAGPGGDRVFARSGSIEEDDDVWNAIGGVRGRIVLGASNWSIPYYADMGAGDCDFTWQVFSALAYSFDRWDLALGYRHLEFEADDDDALIQDLYFSGPILGFRFAF